MIIVFDLTNKISFENVLLHAKLIDDCKTSKVNISLVGNKSDLDTERKVSFEDASMCASKLDMSYFEISAKTGLNVNMMF